MNLRTTSPRGRQTLGALILLLPLAASSAPAAGSGLDETIGYPRDIRIQAGVNFESWSADRTGVSGEALDQGGGYLSVQLPLGSRLLLDLASGWANSDWGPNGSLSGFQDSRGQLSWKVGERFVVRGGFGVPTGETDLSLTELRVARGVADRFKGYAVSRVGEGFDYGVSAAYALPLAGGAASVAGGYLVKGPYTVAVDQEDYEPGDQVNLAAGYSMASPAFLWRSTGLVTLYGTDQLGGRDAFQFGNKLSLESLLRARGGAVRWQLRARAILQEDSRVARRLGELPSGTEESRGVEVYLDATAEIPVSRSFTLEVLLGGRMFGENDEGAGDGRRVDLGAGCSWNAAGPARLFAGGRYSVGTYTDREFPVDGTREDLDLEGFAVKAGIEIRP